MGGGRGHVPTAPQNSEKKLGNYHVKCGHFSGKYHEKFQNFVTFSGIYNKNSGSLIIFQANIT